MSTTSTQRDVVGIYTRWAFIYDVWTWFTERKSLWFALDQAAIRNGEAILEVAVGSGVVFQEILRRNPSGRNVGIDLTEKMLRLTRRKAEQSSAPFELLVADALALPFPDASFDLVVNNNMLGLVPEREFIPILSEMWRVLCPGGRLVLVTMMRPQRLLGWLIYQIGAVWLGGWREVRIKHFVHQVGFQVTKHQTVEQLGIPSAVLIAQKSL